MNRRCDGPCMKSSNISAFGQKNNPNTAIEWTKPEWTTYGQTSLPKTDIGWKKCYTIGQYLY